MGDRAIIQFTDGKEFGPAVYLHWDGGNVAHFLEEAAPRMRKGDVTYSTARFIGECHNEIDGALSLGVWSTDGKVTESHGDAGAFIVNVDDGTIEIIDGYGFEDNCAPQMKFYEG